jgi:alkaline phosphatase D
MVQFRGEFLNLTQFDPGIRSQAKIVGPFTIFPKSEADAENIYGALNGKSDKFVVYRRAHAPPSLHADGNPRFGDPIVVETGPYVLGFNDLKEPPFTPKGGNHGYDPARVPEMKATFITVGPDIQQNVSIPSFENVDVYPLIAHILNLDITHLKTGPIDGDLGPVRTILKQH